MIEPLLYELHDMARERGIEGYRRMSKTELLEVVGDGQHVGGPTTVERSVRRGLGLAVLSTSKGILSDKAAREQSVGGELLCTVC